MANLTFTIVASNYLTLAETLGDSIIKYNPDAQFFIVIADDLVSNIQSKYNLISVYDIGISQDDILDMAYKYNITEFCTSIKPSSFKYLIKKYNPEKVIYFDPDVYLYDNVNYVFDEIDTNELCLVTPHYFTPQVNYSGYTNEEMILFVGIFNFGFFAVNARHHNINLLLDWWENRLKDKCYADKIEGLHTDQKWMDFLPAYFGSDVKIIRHLGWNIALWNLHERLIVNSGNYLVTNRIKNDNKNEKLIFIHFAGFDVKDTQIIHKYYSYTLVDHPELVQIYKNYRAHLLENNFLEKIKSPYKFSVHSNGTKITKFHRRLYKVIAFNKKDWHNPFDAGSEKSFYYQLKKNNLLSKDNSDDLKQKSLKDFSGKIKTLNLISKTIMKVLGFDKYSLLLRFSARYIRPENQTFLIDGHQYEVVNEDIKETIYINKN